MNNNLLSSSDEFSKENNKYREIEKFFKDKSLSSKKKQKQLFIKDVLVPQVIDFRNCKYPKNFDSIIEKIKISSDKYDFQDKSSLTFIDPKEWTVHALSSHKGFLIIQNPFKPGVDIQLIRKFLEEYINPPNLTNLNFHFGDDVHKNLWRNALHENTEANKEFTKYQDYLKKLSWCTLGYQYIWSERKYVKEKFVEFPQELQKLTNELSLICGFSPYKAEAAIINFYDENQSMGGHLDNAEYEMTKPIVSISFGNQAIFLLGGETRDIEPIPILVRSGDVIIMGGRSRYCYHGVARILDNTLPESLKIKRDTVPEINEDLLPFLKYIEHRRINVNIRQVFNAS